MFKELKNPLSLSPESRLCEWFDQKYFKEDKYARYFLLYPLMIILNWTKLIFLYDELTLHTDIKIKAYSMRNKAKIMMNEFLFENIGQVSL
jgi:hypothetical protein